MNTQFRKPLPGSSLDYFDVRAAVEAIQPGASLPKTWCAAATRPP